MLPRRPAAVSGGEFSHPVAPAREGILPSTGNWTTAGWVVARRSWLALLKSVVHSFVSWSICSSSVAASVAADVDDGLGEGLGCFLRQGVTDLRPPGSGSPSDRNAAAVPAVVHYLPAVAVTA